MSLYIESIKNELLLEKYEIIELKVRGKEELRHKLFSEIQDFYDMAHDEWDESLAMLTMTFDKKPEEKQSINTIKRFTKDFIEREEEKIS